MYQVESAGHKIQVSSDNGMEAAKSFVSKLLDNEMRFSLGDFILVTEVRSRDKTIVPTNNVLEQLGLVAEPIRIMKLCV
jgi:hypothetical protein